MITETQYISKNNTGNKKYTKIVDLLCNPKNNFLHVEGKSIEGGSNSFPENLFEMKESDHINKEELVKYETLIDNVFCPIQQDKAKKFIITYSNNTSITSSREVLGTLINITFHGNNTKTCIKVNIKDLLFLNGEAVAMGSFKNAMTKVLELIESMVNDMKVSEDLRNNEKETLDITFFCHVLHNEGPKSTHFLISPSIPTEYTNRSNQGNIKIFTCYNGKTIHPFNYYNPSPLVASYHSGTIYIDKAESVITDKGGRARDYHSVSMENSNDLNPVFDTSIPLTALNTEKSWIYFPLSKNNVGFPIKIRYETEYKRYVTLFDQYRIFFNNLVSGKKTMLSDQINRISEVTGEHNGIIRTYNLDVHGSGGKIQRKIIKGPIKYTEKLLKEIKESNNPQITQFIGEAAKELLNVIAMPHNPSIFSFSNTLSFSDKMKDTTVFAYLYQGKLILSRLLISNNLLGGKLENLEKSSHNIKTIDVSSIFETQNEKKAKKIQTYFDGISKENPGNNKEHKEAFQFCDAGRDSGQKTEDNKAFGVAVVHSAGITTIAIERNILIKVYTANGDKEPYKYGVIEGGNLAMVIVEGGIVGFMKMEIKPNDSNILPNILTSSELIEMADFNKIIKKAACVLVPNFKNNLDESTLINYILKLDVENGTISVIMRDIFYKFVLACVEIYRYNGGLTEFLKKITDGDIKSDSKTAAEFLESFTKFYSTKITREFKEKTKTKLGNDIPIEAGTNKKLEAFMKKTYETIVGLIKSLDSISVQKPNTPDISSMQVNLKKGLSNAFKEIFSKNVSEDMQNAIINNVSSMINLTVSIQNERLKRLRAQEVNTKEENKEVVVSSISQYFEILLNFESSLSGLRINAVKPVTEIDDKDMKNKLNLELNTIEEGLTTITPQDLLGHIKRIHERNTRNSKGDLVSYGLSEDFNSMTQVKKK